MPTGLAFSITLNSVARVPIPVIFLQIVIVSPGTHLVKNHESQTRTIQSQFKKQRVFKIENAWAFVCNQTVNLETDFKT